MWPLKDRLSRCRAEVSPFVHRTYSTFKADVFWSNARKCAGSDLGRRAIVRYNREGIEVVGTVIGKFETTGFYIQFDQTFINGRGTPFCSTIVKPDEHNFVFDFVRWID